MILYFSAIRLGAGVNPLPHALSPPEIKKQIALIEPRVVFLDSKHAAADPYHEAGQVFDLGAGHQRLAEALHAQPAEFDPHPGGDTVACFYYSSGTTTDPKCVMYSHRNMVALVDSICRGFGFTDDTVHLGCSALGAHGDHQLPDAAGGVWRRHAHPV